MSIAKKFQKLRETKEALRVVGEIDKNEPFSRYPAKIQEKINSGGSHTNIFSTIWETSNNYNMIIQKLAKEIPNDILQEAFNNQSVIRMDQSFAYCQNLEKLDLSNCKVDTVTSMSNLCTGSTKLKQIIMKNLNLKSVTQINSAFSNLKELQEIDFTNTDTSNISNFITMCSSCSNLIRFIGVLDVIKNTANIVNIFATCPNLEEVYIKNLNSSGLKLSDSPKLKKECLVYLLENANSTSETRTLILGSTNLAKLTAEEIAVATNKGWTLS